MKKECRGSPSTEMTICHSIDDVPQTSWDAVIGATPSAQHGSLRTFEFTNKLSVAPHYFLLGDKGRPSAVAVGYLVSSTKHYERVAKPLLGRAQALTPVLARCLGPTLLLGLRPTNGPAMLTDDRGGDEVRRSNLLDICANIEDWADERGISLAVMGLTDHDQALIDVLRQREFDETFSYPTAELEVTWDNWEGYLQRLKSKRRTVVRREAKTFASSGCRIRRLDPGEPVPPEGYDLILQHLERKKNKNLLFGRALFDALRSNLPDNALIYLAEDKDQLLGIAGVVRKDSVASASYLGISTDARAANTFVYFNLAYYQLVRDAPSIGIKRILYGSTVYQGKSQRGCKINSTRLFLRPGRAMTRKVFKKALEFHRRWYDQKFRDFYTPADT